MWAFVLLFACVKSFRKKNKEFKTTLITSFTLILIYKSLQSSADIGCLIFHINMFVDENF